MSYHTSRLAIKEKRKKKEKKIVSVREDMEELEPSYTAIKNVK